VKLLKCLMECEYIASRLGSWKTNMIKSYYVFIAVEEWKCVPEINLDFVFAS